MEYVDPEMRTIVGNVPLAVFLTLGAASLPWIAYGCADWRLFSIVTSAPIAIMVVAWWIVPESARWLVLQGKIEETVDILKECARVNNKVVDQSVYDEFKVCFYNISLLADQHLVESSILCTGSHVENLPTGKGTSVRLDGSTPFTQDAPALLPHHAHLVRTGEIYFSLPFTSHPHWFSFFKTLIHGLVGIHV